MNEKYIKKIRYCEKHGEYSLSDYDVDRGRGCLKCGRERTQKAVSESKSFKKEIPEGLRMFIVSCDEFGSWENKGVFKCSVCGKEFERSVRSAVRSYNTHGRCECNSCANKHGANKRVSQHRGIYEEISEKMVDTKKLSRNIPQWVFEELSTEYKEDLYSVGCDDYVMWHCPVHGDYPQTLRMHVNLRTGERRQGCRKCSIVRNNKNRNRTIRPYRWEPYVNDLMYEEDKKKALLGDLPINADDIWFVCSVCGYEYEQRPYNHLNGAGCPECARKNNSTHRTRFENEIGKFLDEHGIDYRQSDKTVIKGPDGHWMEVDYNLTGRNKAIECDCSYWHEEIYDTYQGYLNDLNNRTNLGYRRGKWKGYAQWKDLKCKEQGIELFHVWFEKWNENEDEVKKQILDFIEGE